MPLYENLFSTGVARFIFFAALAGALVTAFPDALPHLTAEIRAAIQERDAMAGPDYGLQEVDAVSRRVRELGEGDPLVRRYAAWALGELEETRGVGPLIESLGDENADVRLVAAWALGEIKDYMAIPPLIELLEDADPLVREMAVLALGEIEHPAAVESLSEAYRREAGLREPVIWALGEIGGREAEAERSAIFAAWGRGSWENDEVWTGRLGSTEAIALDGDLNALLAALTDDDPWLRRSAAECLGCLGDERAVEGLLDALRDPEPAVRAMAIWALDEINPSRSREHKGEDCCEH